jgi:hypothetical protein
MLFVDRCETVAVVALRVRLAADPEEPKIKKPERGAQCTLLRHAWQLEITCDRPPRGRELGSDL